MTWVLLIGVGWLLVALLVGVLIGRGIRLADRKEQDRADVTDPNFVVDLAPPAPTATVPEPAPIESAAPADDARAADRGRQPIPGARSPAARNSVRPAERGSSTHESGLS
jgi:hypothetical protein